MTGREWISYILENHLENEEMFKDGKLLGFMTAMEAAAKFEVGVSTINVWFHDGTLKGLMIAGEIYIPANAKNPKERTTDEKTITIVSDSHGCRVDVMSMHPYFATP